jgi:hypothetical protein
MLQANLSVNETECILNYELTNRVGEVIYVLDVLDATFWRTPLMGSHSRSLAFVFCDGEEGVLFWQGRSVAPSFATQRPTWATRVEPGATLTSRIVQPVPLLEWHAHEPPELRPTVERRVSNVRFAVQFFRASDVGYVDEVDVGLPAPACAVLGERSFFAEILLTGVAPLTVLCRTDAFDRFDIARLAPLYSGPDGPASRA